MLLTAFRVAAFPVLPAAPVCRAWADVAGAVSYRAWADAAEYILADTCHTSGYKVLLRSASCKYQPMDLLSESMPPAPEIFR